MPVLINTTKDCTDFGPSVNIQQWGSAITAGVSWLGMSIDELVNSAETDGRS